MKHEATAFEVGESVVTWAELRQATVGTVWPLGGDGWWEHSAVVYRTESGVAVLHERAVENKITEVALVWYAFAEPH